MKTIAAVLFALVLLGHGGQAETLEARVRHALAVGRAKATHTAAVYRDSTRLPRSTDLRGMWTSVSSSDWTSGFFPGVLWQLFDWSKDPGLRRDAEFFTQKLASQQFNTGTHDVGFMMYCSYGNAYRLFPSDTSKQILLQSARSLASRFDPRVGCIKSWDGRKQWGYPVIIDNMMNLELLLWASRNGAPAAMRDIAIRHAEHTMVNHFRSDGSTYHVVDYDTVTGEVVRKQTHQGFADESVWSRGQAWAVYGFTMLYRETHDGRFLSSAQRAADFFIAHLPADGVPYWDFEAPGIPDAARDASAAAIAASALFELSRLMRESDRQVHYRSAAEKILSSLVSPAYLAAENESQGILKHTTGNHPKGSEIDVSLIYGDYYFVEAMLRYLH